MIQGLSVFLFHYPEQVTSILKVAYGHKMVVAALATESSSPGRKKEGVGKRQKVLAYPPVPFNNFHIHHFFTEKQWLQ